MEWVTYAIIAGGLVFTAWAVWEGLGIVVIAESQVGIVTKKFAAKNLPNGRVIALNGEAGVQAETLTPGWHFFTWFWQFKVEKANMTKIPPGQIGLVMAIDGGQIETNRILAKNVPCDNFQSARTFLQAGGEKGKQLAVLTAGNYRINTALFTVTLCPVTNITTNTVGIVTALDGCPLDGGEIAGPVVANHNNFQDIQAFINGGGKRGLQEQVILAGQWNLNPWFVSVKPVEMTTVNIGYVGVVTSYVGKAHVDISGDEFKHGDMVDTGHKGVWAVPLYPGKHPINTDITKVDLVPTTNVVLNWATNRSESHKLDEKLSSITVRSKDGFSYNLDVSVVIHIGAKAAAKVILRMGSVAGLISQVLEPTIGNYFRNAAQEFDALDFLKNRTGMQTKAAGFVREALNNYDVEAVDTLIGDIVLPQELLATQTQRKMAEEMKITYEIQEKSSKQQESLNRQSALTEIQNRIVEAEQGVNISKLKANQQAEAAVGETKVAEQKANQTIRIAEADAAAVTAKAKAEATRIEQVTAAEAKGIEAKGRAQANAYKVGADAMGQENFALLETMTAIGEKKVKLIPDLLINGGGSGEGGGGAGMGIMNLLMASMMKDRMDKGGFSFDGKIHEKDSTTVIVPATASTTTPATRISQTGQTSDKNDQKS